MTDREKVIRGLECCLPMTTRNGLADCKQCPYDRKITLEGGVTECCHDLMADAIALLKAQDQRHRLEVHNIGNVDMPECVSKEQFYAVMNNVIAALEHTDKGESWPYDEEGR